MKAFRFNIDFRDYDYPDDCNWIYDYLRDVGTLNIDPYSIPKYYRMFSNEVYNEPWKDCWGNDDIREKFAMWLSEKDV